MNTTEHCTVKDCRYVIVREDLYEESLKHTAEHNFPNEPVCKSLGMTMDKEAEYICTCALQQNMSIALISARTGEIIGQRVIHIGSKHDKIDMEQYQVQANRKFIKLYEEALKYVDLWKHYDVDEAFEFFGLSVHKEYRRMGIGIKLMQAAILFIKSMNLGLVLAKGLCDSNYSKRIYERLDFDCLGEIKFEDYKVNGEQVVTNIGEHKSLKIYGKII